MRVTAGELGHRHVGKSAEVTYTHGNITSTVRDVIEKVTHETEGTRLFFVGTRWTPNTLSILSGPVDQGLLVGSTLYIHVEE